MGWLRFVRLVQQTALQETEGLAVMVFPSGSTCDTEYGVVSDSPLGTKQVSGAVEGLTVVSHCSATVQLSDSHAESSSVKNKVVSDDLDTAVPD